MEKFTNSALNRDAVSFKDAFEETLASKVFDALEAKKLEVAQNIFNGEVEIKEHGNDGFGSNKTSGNVTKGWPAAKHSSQGLPHTKEKSVEETKMCPHCEMSMSKCKCDHMEEEVEQIDEGKAPSDIENKLKKLHGGFGKIKQKGKNTFTHTSEGENEDGDPAKITHTYILNKKGKLVHIGTQSVVEEVEQIDELSLDTLHNAAAEAEHERDYGDPQKRKKFRRQAKFFNRAANAATDHYEKKLIIRDRKGNPIGYRNNAKPVSYPREEVELDEGMHKHEKKHGKMHHKLAKKMMKLAHKHAKKHHHEEEEE